MRPLRLLAAITALALLAGCQSGTISAVIPIAGGGQITVPVTPEGPIPGQTDGYRVVRATISPSKEQHELRYEFGLAATKQPPQPAVRRIQIDDLSDEKPIPLVDDPNPQFPNGEWTTQTEMIPSDDPRLQWMFQITRSLRVYRIVLTTTDGRRLSFDQVTMYPPNLKAAIRQLWGEKY